MRSDRGSGLIHRGERGGVHFLLGDHMRYPSIWRQLCHFHRVPKIYDKYCIQYEMDNCMYLRVKGIEYLGVW